MSSYSIVYVGIYTLIYINTILGAGIVSRDGLPRDGLPLPSGILKIEKYCPGLKVRSPEMTRFQKMRTRSSTEQACTDATIPKWFTVNRLLVVLVRFSYSE